MILKDYLLIIPAREGSKGIPGKNAKLLHGKPLIQYSIEYARYFTRDENICISTNDSKVFEVARSLNINIPFTRPESISTDASSADEVIKHALNYYEALNNTFKAVVYLQPTSPFRKYKHLEEAIKLFENEGCEMVVSVCESHLNPYFSLFEQNKSGFLSRSKPLPEGITRRQDVPKVFQYNGSIFVIDIKSLLKTSLHSLTRIKKYQMDSVYSIDIDTPLDWKYAEFLVKENFIEYDS